VSLEIAKLPDVVTRIYNFEAEISKVSDQGSYNANNQNVLAFIRDQRAIKN
jgi:hypothetical protein